VGTIPGVHGPGLFSKPWEQDTKQHSSMISVSVPALNSPPEGLRRWGRGGRRGRREGGVEGGGGGGRACPPPFSATWRSWLAQTQQCARARTLKEVFTGTGSDSTAKQGSQLQVAFFFFCIATPI